MDKELFKIWKVIDKIAYINGLSTSALAKKAGLDSTAFNKSKRLYNTGKLRGISFGTVYRVLKVTDTNWEKFAQYMNEIDTGDGL